MKNSQKFTLATLFLIQSISFTRAQDLKIRDVNVYHKMLNFPSKPIHFEGKTFAFSIVQDKNNVIKIQDKELVEIIKKNSRFDSLKFTDTDPDFIVELYLVTTAPFRSIDSERKPVKTYLSTFCVRDRRGLKIRETESVKNYASATMMEVPNDPGNRFPGVIEDQIIGITETLKPEMEFFYKGTGYNYYYIKEDNYQRSKGLADSLKKVLAYKSVKPPYLEQKILINNCIEYNSHLLDSFLLTKADNKKLIFGLHTNLANLYLLNGQLDSALVHVNEIKKVDRGLFKTELASKLVETYITQKQNYEGGIKAFKEANTSVFVAEKKTATDPTGESAYLKGYYVVGESQLECAMFIDYQTNYLKNEIHVLNKDQSFTQKLRADKIKAFCVDNKLYKSIEPSLTKEEQKLLYNYADDPEWSDQFFLSEVLFESSLVYFGIVNRKIGPRYYLMNKATNERAILKIATPNSNFFPKEVRLFFYKCFHQDERLNEEIKNMSIESDNLNDYLLIIRKIEGYYGAGEEAYYKAVKDLEDAKTFNPNCK
jgi:hypothetical protein